AVYGDGSTTLNISLSGIVIETDASNNKTTHQITRTAVLTLVPDRVLFLQLLLSRDCIDLTCDMGGQGAAGALTCIDGHCASNHVNPASLPDFTGENQGLTQCQSATDPIINTATGMPIPFQACKADEVCVHGTCLKNPPPGSDGG